MSLAQTCQQLARENDAVCRFGGEEFVLLFAHTNTEQGLHYAERLRERLAQKQIDIEGPQRQVTITVSGGITSFQTGDTTQKMLTRADQALYKAKRSGKNKIEVCDFRDTTS